MKVFITGTAGFVGFHLAKELLQDGFEVWGIDSLNEYYDVNLKYDRLAITGISRSSVVYNQPLQSSLYPGYTFIQLKLQDRENIFKIFERERFDTVVNLAAQAGVRYSIVNPFAYLDSNIDGFLNILEACRQYQVGHLVYASSSSVYGSNETIPFSTSHVVDHPISLYAASKKSNELMAHAYSHLFALPVTGLRFFTVYGPWGRPDMALFLFTKAILENRPIQVFNHGEMERDFTYVGDIVGGVKAVIRSPAKANPFWDGKQPDPATSTAPYRLYNIGNNNPVRLTDFIDQIEAKLGRKAKREYLPLQAGDVPSTYADITNLVNDVGYKPKTSLETGIANFVDWYVDYYKVRL